MEVHVELTFNVLYIPLCVHKRNKSNQNSWSFVVFTELFLVVNFELFGTSRQDGQTLERSHDSTTKRFLAVRGNSRRLF